MPKPLRVIIPDQGIKFNAVLDQVTSVGDFHAAGYRQAAEILLRRFLDDPDGTAGERDSLVLPILFLFRHYLELRFKDIIVYGQCLTGQHPRYPVEEKHDLKKLWEKVQKLYKAILGPGCLSEFDKIGKCVTDLCELDPKSESFRYPCDKNSRPIFKHVVIGLKTLHTTVESIGNCLDGISDEMESRWKSRG